jgi:signal transduction histidine kinase
MNNQPQVRTVLFFTGFLLVLLWLVFHVLLDGQYQHAADISRQFTATNMPADQLGKVCELGDTGPDDQPGNPSGFYSTADAVVLRAQLQQDFSQSNHILEIPYTMLAYIDVCIGTQQAKHAHRSGMRVAVNDRSLKDNSNVFLLPKTIGVVDVTLAITTDGPLAFRALLWDQTDWLEHQGLVKLFYGLFFGMVIALIIYNILDSYVLNDASCLYYVLYLVAQALLIGTYSGLTKLYLWPDIGYLDTQLMYVFMALSVWFGLMFCVSFLRVREQSPGLYRLGMVIIIGSVMVSVANLFGLWPSYMMQLYFLMNFFALFYYTLIPLRHYLRGQRDARFVFVGFMVLAFTIAYTSLQGMGMIDNPTPGQELLSLGILIEGFSLSVALTERIRAIRQDKLISEQKLKAATRAFTRSLIEREEKGHAEISSYLHDSIGHDLIVIIQRLEAEGNPSHAAVLKGCQTLLANIRNLSGSMHPHVLINIGLTAAVEQLLEHSFEHTQTEWALDISIDESRVDDEVSIAVYRVIQEALSNILKHAAAAEVLVQLWIQGDAVVGRIKDDGRGMSGESGNTRHSGLAIMQGRIKLLNGQIELQSQPDEGLCIEFMVPLNGVES